MKRNAILFGIGLLLALPLAFIRIHDPRDVVYVPSPPAVVDAMLELAAIRPGDVVYDLGCGDGRILVGAATRHGVKAFGFDIDPLRVQESRENAVKARVDHLVTVAEADLFTLDLSAADVVMIYLSPALNLRLIPQLNRMKPGSRIVSHDFDMPGVPPREVVRVKFDGARDRVVYMWTTPIRESKRSE